MNLLGLLKVTLMGGALLLALALPALAPAATVSVEVGRGTFGSEEAEFGNLRFTAAPGEDNAVEVRTVTAEHGLHLILSVTDSGAPLTAGAGCGTAGSAVWCDLPYPRGPQTTNGPFKGKTPVPGTRVVGLMTIELGDGRNSFEDLRFGAELDHSFAATVTAGAGEDRIVTGGGDDLVDPGAGSDFVRTNDGQDRVLATDVPDGPDVYELGSDYYNPARFGADAVDYRRRSAPVEWDAPSGMVAGEGDLITGTENVFGGSGDDVLRGDEFENFLVGGAGNDLVFGGSNWDVLMGGDGDDVLRGGRGHDVLGCGDGLDQALGIGRDREIRCEALRFLDGSGLDSLLRATA